MPMAKLIWHIAYKRRYTCSVFRSGCEMSVAMERGSSVASRVARINGSSSWKSNRFRARVALDRGGLCVPGCVWSSSFSGACSGSYGLAAAGMSLALKRNLVLPMVRWSPVVSSKREAGGILVPFSAVPLREYKSSRKKWVSSWLIQAWSRLASGSSSWIAWLILRPR